MDENRERNLEKEGSMGGLHMEGWRMKNSNEKMSIFSSDHLLFFKFHYIIFLSLFCFSSLFSFLFSSLIKIKP